MKRTFATYVLLGLLGGCSYIHPDGDCGCASSTVLPAQRPPAGNSAQWAQNGNSPRPVWNLGDLPAPTTPSSQSLTISRPTAVAAAAPRTVPPRALDGSTPIGIPDAAPANPVVDAGSRTIPPKPTAEVTPVVAESPSVRPATLPEKEPDIAPPPKYVLPAVSDGAKPETKQELKSEPKPEPTPETKSEPKPISPDGPSLEVGDARADKPKEFHLDGPEPSAVAPHPVATEKPKNGAGPVVRLVNQREITLNYKVDGVGPTGVSAVELWYTRDGKSWKRDETGTETKPPYIIAVQEEGLYGFTLLAKNGIGLSNDPPKSGDAPQVWVEVDLTKPSVSLTEVKAGVDGKGPVLNIGWKAHDKNMINQPITISYSEKEKGPWQPIVTHLENTGKFAWPLRGGLPGKIFVRVEARDLAGNVGSAKTAAPVQIDLMRPVVHIMEVEPGKH
jgi:hypothetical protein